MTTKYTPCTAVKTVYSTSTKQKFYLTILFLFLSVPPLPPCEQTSKKIKMVDANQMEITGSVDTTAFYKETCRTVCENNVDCEAWEYNDPQCKVFYDANDLYSVSYVVGGPATTSGVKECEGTNSQKIILAERYNCNCS